MIFLGYYNVDKIGSASWRTRSDLGGGFITLEILLAFSLAILFTASITQMSVSTSNVFEYAREKNKLLNVFETNISAFSDLMPYESEHLLIEDSLNNFATTSVNATGYWYGNDRIETIVTVLNSTNYFASSTSGIFASSTVHSPYNQSLQFRLIRKFPFDNINDTIGTSLCSVNFMNKSDDQISIQPISLPIDPLLPLTDLEVRNGVAYISADSNVASDPDLLIINISNATNTQLLGNLNTGPGIVSLALADNHIYTAATSASAQLHIIRLNGLNSFTIENKYKLPPPYATATQPLGSSIFYNKGKIYLGTEKWDGDEFNIIDISNPTSPSKRGGLEIGSKVNDIYIRDNIAYIADSDEQQMRVVDVSNAGNSTTINQFNPSGWQRQEGKVLIYFEDRLNLGRTSGGFNINKDHEIFSWATTSNQTLNEFKSTDISGGAYGILLDREHVYLATRSLNKEFMIFNNQLSTSTALSFSLPVAPQAMTCHLNKIYILAHTAPVIYEISFE